MIGMVSGKSFTSIHKLQVPAEVLHRPARAPCAFSSVHAALIMQLAVAEEMIEPQRRGCRAHATGEAPPPARSRRRPRHRATGRDVAPAHRASPNCRGRARCPAPARRGQSRACRASPDIFQRRVRRRVAAGLGIGKARGRPEHMRMGVAGAGRRRHFRRTGRLRSGTGWDHGCSISPVRARTLRSLVLVHPARSRTPASRPVKRPPVAAGAGFFAITSQACRRRFALRARAHMRYMPGCGRWSCA